MKMPRPVTIDFETEGIDARPVYPPKPVGVSIKYPGKAPRYYAWGHPTENNSTLADGKAALAKAWAWKDGLLFQNGKFDCDVAEVHMGLALPEWHRIHDTMFLLFLDDPHQQELSLKPAAARLLDMPPDEQDAVGDWLVERQPVPGVKISRSKASDHYFGRYICLAPGKLVGTYANGDVVRTEKLFELLWPKTEARGMLAAYDRERRLMPVLLRMEREGVHVPVKQLNRDINTLELAHADVDKWIRKQLRSKDLNIDSGPQLVDALIAAGKADESLMPVTKTGKVSTAKSSLLLGVSDKRLLGALKYRTQLGTCLKFMVPWCNMAMESGGRIFTTWNQVKAPQGDANVGTRTGRLSATWFMNMPKEFTPIFDHEDPGKGLPRSPIEDLPTLPLVRSYIVPPTTKHVFVDRDYSQQEPRILAHFDGAQLCAAYNETPWIDFHDSARDELAKMGLHYERKPVKNTNLGLIYGMGVGKLAEKNNMTVDEARRLKSAILTLYPGLAELYREMKVRSKMGEPIRTWGGREYYCEEPKFVDGRLREFDYKMVNVLIQGSAADCTKEAVLRFDRDRDPAWKLPLTVHDELCVSAPKKQMHEAMECLRESMEGVEFDVPMLSEGSVGLSDWANLVDYDVKGVRTWR